MKRRLLLLLSFPALIHAQPVSLDPGFGHNGAAVSQTEGWGKEASNIIRQPDGKLVVAGVEWKKGDMIIQQSIITRFLPDGQLDNSFGAQGTAKLITGNKNGAQAISLQTDGKIVVAANETIIQQQGNSVTLLSRPFIARLNADGSPDAGFGTNGILSLELLDAHFMDKDLAAIAVLPNGKILAGGSGLTAAGSKMIVLRLNADGSYDNSFGVSGLGQYTIENGMNAGLWDMAVQDDGKVILAGTSGSSSLPTHDDLSFALARIHADGTPDVTFGTQGMVTTRLSGPFGLEILDIAHRVLVQADGRIYLAGAAGRVLGLARYLPDGSPDPTFGQNGKIVHPAHPAATGIALRNGKLYACGMLPVADYVLDISLSAFNADGSADNTFAPDGLLTTHIFDKNYAHALLVQPDGKLVTAGALSHGPGSGEGGLLLTRLMSGATTGIVSQTGKQASITLYPNPADEELTLAFNTSSGMPQCDIIITSATGQTVYTGSFTAAKIKIPVGHLASGIYAVRVNTGTGVQTLRFTKK